MNGSQTPRPVQPAAPPGLARRAAAAAATAEVAETRDADASLQHGTTLRPAGKDLFASWFDDMSEPATVQAASFVAAFEESWHIPLEERLGPFGLEWEREQEERRG